MSSSILTKAAMIVAPNDLGAAANEFGCKKYTAETTHRADVVPDGWRGRWVTIQAIGGAIDVAFSLSSSAEVDRAVAASNAGASAKVGRRIPSGEERDMLIPKGDGHASVYFVRESDTAGAAALLTLSDREL